MAALRWLAAGYGYEITGADVWKAYRHTMEAAVNAGCEEAAGERLRKLVSEGGSAAGFVRKVLEGVLGVSDRGRAS